MVVDSNPVAVTQTSDFSPVSSKEFLDIQVTTECRFTLKHVCDMTRTYSLPVIVAIFSSKFTWINVKSTFLSTDTSLVATESHTSHTTWSKLITNHLVD